MSQHSTAEETDVPVPGSTPRRNDQGRSTRPVLGACGVSRIVGTTAMGLGVAVVMIATLVLVRSTIGMASARIAGSTSNDSSALDTATIDLTLGGGDAGSDETASQDLAIDATGLWPGRIIERCVPVRYSGSLDDVDVGVWVSDSLQGNLTDLVLLTIATGSGGPDCAEFETDAEMFAGTLAELAAGHQSYETAVPVMTGAVDGATTTLRVTAEVADDNAAQGRAVEFWLMVEARP